MPNRRPTPRSRSPRRESDEQPQPPEVPGDQEHHKCAHCEGNIPTEAGWKNWVYMAPGGPESFALLKRILSILQYGSYIDRSGLYLGVHGSYVPFCKSCMVELARKLKTNHSFTQSSAQQDMTEEDKQVAEKTDECNMDLALMAGLLSQQFLDKSRDAMEKLQSEDQDELTNPFSQMTVD